MKKMRKAIVSLALVAAMAVPVMAGTQFDNAQFDNAQFDNVPRQTIDGTEYVALRLAAYAHGHTVDFNGETREGIKNPPP